MPENDEMHNVLLGIHSRLGTIEGKINLVARAERAALLAVLKEAFEQEPLLAQIYILIDGQSSQGEILERLSSFGIRTSIATVSRRMDTLVTELGVAEDVAPGRSRVLRRNRSAEDVLNLQRNARRWLEDTGQVVPEVPVRRIRKKS